MTFRAPQSDLIRILLAAYSGERGAALAYRGHWHSVRNPLVREEIQKIEAEEWQHRNIVLEMLRTMDAAPYAFRDWRLGVVGRILGFLCHISGWVAPMYGAGWIEARNVREYEAAARAAHQCGRTEWCDALLTLAEVEWDHEAYFRGKVLGHWLGSRMPIWAPLPSRPSIRSAFKEFINEPLMDETTVA